MKFIKTKIEGLIILEPRKFEDKRCYFLESYNQALFCKNIYDVDFIQDNESKSTKGVLRGLHYQKPPFDQAKLVRCIDGRVLDVAVDIRKNSKTFGQHVSLELSADNKRQLFIPRGFAHGFLVLSKSAILAYKVDNAYAPDYDTGIRWDDPILNIHWGIDNKEVLVSEKDSELPYFSEFKSLFNF